jgi:hypothetical protein
MGFQVPITIADSIKRIRERRLLLPAIQRNFVWSHAKIEWLFDSLLQDYPIGSFLFWDVRDAQSKTDYKYYEFLREYREEYRTENPEFNTDGHADFDAVLDGQQRLTALYIGFCGSYAYYRGRVWWENTEHALPTRHLYLNLRDRAPEDEDQAGRVFEFKFLTEHEYKEESEKWFLVGRILELTNFTKFSQMLIAGGYQQNEFATDALSKLQESIHTKPLINYYRIENADMERALNVFVRVNSAEPLSLSDMLMSTAIAHWKIKDARKEIPALVNDIRSLGFFVDKDLILKTCLYLYSSDIRYRVSNFTAARVKPFEDNWDAIRASVLAVFTLIRDFGYSDKSLSSKNTLLPVIYWVHHRELAAGLTTQVGFRAERDSIRAWIHIMLLKGIIGAGSADTVLAAIRRAFLSDTFGVPYLKPEITNFPVIRIAEILKEQRKDPSLSEEFLNSLLYTQKDAKQAFTILSLLAPNLDYKNGDFHADHLHPASAFKSRNLGTAGIAKEDFGFFQDVKNWNSILNLAHLDANENKSKQDRPLEMWVSGEAIEHALSPNKFCTDHLLPPPDCLKFQQFREFIAIRHKLLSAKLTALLEQ